MSSSILRPAEEGTGALIESSSRRHAAIPSSAAGGPTAASMRTVDVAAFDQGSSPHLAGESTGERIENSPPGPGAISCASAAGGLPVANMRIEGVIASGQEDIDELGTPSSSPHPVVEGADTRSL